MSFPNSSHIPEHPLSAATGPDRGAYLSPEGRRNPTVCYTETQVSKAARKKTTSDLGDWQEAGENIWGGGTIWITSLSKAVLSSVSTVMTKGSSVVQPHSCPVLPQAGVQRTA